MSEKTTKYVGIVNDIHNMLNFKIFPQSCSIRYWQERRVYQDELNVFNAKIDVRKVLGGII